MTPKKPFPSYMWRWLSLTPSEGILNQPVFIGALRVLARHEGESFSSDAVFADLKATEIELDQYGNTITLARDNKRNVVRNSGQYWRGTGLLSADQGIIHLTQLGRDVASGRVTQGEFVALTIQQTVLPNPATADKDEFDNWHNAGLQIRPFELILQVISSLGENDLMSAFLDNDELTKIVIPLAGAKTDAIAIANHVHRHRIGKLNIDQWPNCVPGDNDKRLSHELLLFLANFGVLHLRKRERRREKRRYYLDELFDFGAVTPKLDCSIFGDEADSQNAVEAIKHSDLPSIVDRQRLLTVTSKRPGQEKFRAAVMKAYKSRCILTEETVPEVLEAAHIVPCEHNGADHKDNSFCLRSDIHRLFDSGHLRILPDGTLILTDAVKQSPGYAALPEKIEIPQFVKPANIAWRKNYR